MIFPFFSEYPIGSIRTGLQSALFIVDEDDRWKKGNFIELWYKIPKTAGSYEFAKGRVVELKDVIWYPHDECVRRKIHGYDEKLGEGILTVIHSDGKWNHLKTEDEQFRFLKHCGYLSISQFKEKKKNQFQTKVLCLAPKWGEGKLVLPDISMHQKNG